MVTKVKLQEQFQNPVPMIAMRGLVLFPKTVAQFDVGRKKSIAAVEWAVEHDSPVFLVTQNDVTVENPESSDLGRYGVIAYVRQVFKVSDDYIKVLVNCRSRARLRSVDTDGAFYTCTVARAPMRHLRPEDAERVDALVRSIRRQLEIYISYYPKLSPEVAVKAFSVVSSEELPDFLAGNLIFGYSDKQQILECNDALEKLERFLTIITRENTVLEFERELNEKVKEDIDRHQREYFLREQMQAISDELGMAEDDTAAEADGYTAKIRELRLEADSEEKLLKEAERLRKMQSGNQEATVIRSYLDCCLSLPWNTATEDRFDLAAARRKLDADHYGLTKIKDRIIEMLAVRSVTEDMGSQILCLVGPPGVGKTSIVRSIADCMGRKYVRVALGGVHDESEIRGHRRTYIGSMPGRIMAALTTAKSRNPVILLDEIDKMAADYRGDPASALLEALDPEQNSTFTDHYVDLPFDLSKALFITTANDPAGIPAALYDRMEILELSSYTRQEKFQIAKRHLLPKQMGRHMLTRKQLTFHDKALSRIIDEYTSEAGVRELERLLAKVCRKVLTRIQSGECETFDLTPDHVPELLGVPLIKPAAFSRIDQIGVCNGLAWTAVGGVILPVEVVVAKGTGKLEITGSLGDVMKESAHLAITNAVRLSGEFGYAPDFVHTMDIHIHAPEGAVKKDGPSAGVTLTTALVSALSGREVRHTIAMTGEITLTGAVLPIGGLKEKLLAAEKEGIRRVLIPADNQCDLSEIDEHILRRLKIVPVAELHEVLSQALLPPKAGGRKLLYPTAEPSKEAAACAIKS